MPGTTCPEEREWDEIWGRMRDEGKEEVKEADTERSFKVKGVDGKVKKRRQKIVKITKKGRKGAEYRRRMKFR